MGGSVIAIAGLRFHTSLPSQPWSGCWAYRSLYTSSSFVVAELDSDSCLKEPPWPNSLWPSRPAIVTSVAWAKDRSFYISIKLQFLFYIFHRLYWNNINNNYYFNIRFYYIALAGLELAKLVEFQAGLELTGIYLPLPSECSDTMPGTVIIISKCNYKYVLPLIDFGLYNISCTPGLMVMMCCVILVIQASRKVMHAWYGNWSQGLENGWTYPNTYILGGNQQS